MGVWENERMGENKLNQFILVIGNKNYSSWSLRAWLTLKYFGIPLAEIPIPLYQPGSKEAILKYSPSGKVPTLIHDGVVVWESIAICEYLAELFPEKKLWPGESGERAYARSISAEMHAGFQSLRNNMPMNCRASYPGRGRAPGVDEDIKRIVSTWRECRERFGNNGDFLFGHFTIADAMYAPVVTRFKTYGVELWGLEKKYCDTILALPTMQEWYEAARNEPHVIPEFEL
jgi:glutathione S-transferase